MQIAVVREEYIFIVDKVENNPLLDSKGRPAWSALYDSESRFTSSFSLLSFPRLTHALVLAFPSLQERTSSSRSCHQLVLRWRKLPTNEEGGEKEEGCI